MGEKEKFPVEAGIMRVTHELDEVTPEELEEALQRLVKSGTPAPVVDLADASFLPTYHIGGIRSAAEEARRDERSLTVRARRSIVMMLDRSGVGTVARLKPIE
ncbi:MAG: STAS domain-containing protein [Planctomycetota bacterium]